MKLFSFIQYFFYLGLNWNWKIAFHILSHEIKGEKKYRIHTTGSDELKKTASSGVDISHATIYMPASYLLLEEVFKKLPAKKLTHFLDIGCGKGRALCLAAHNRFKKVSGIDFSKEFIAIAEENLLQTKKIFPSLDYAVINADALKFQIPGDVDCIFFFNPFDEFVMQTVVNNILTSCKNYPRDTYIVYLNPLYKKQFLDIGFVEIFYTCKMKYMEAVILYKNKENP